MKEEIWGDVSIWENLRSQRDVMGPMYAIIGDTGKVSDNVGDVERRRRKNERKYRKNVEMA